ncbi:hypothetical protein E0Z10_g3335 [Xylaria hypoxylon]|uniref:Uncharacterized protein n=1 Tax=Xylaria hypoxylon TaxID=37992 RepID=A0A4Z0Z7P9_9PEZI|nr:hypothetical protein E0Z10_g3335 [Xylaria hypoxylon]
MPVYSLPEVATPLIPKERVITSSIDLSNDYGTPNLAFLYHGLSNAGDLASLWKDVDSWNAWELSIAEEHVVAQLDNDNLPGDDSISSRMIRSAYRGKVIATLREQAQSPWLIKNSSPSPKEFEGDIKKDEVNAKVRERLREFYSTSGVLTNNLVINIIANVIASTQDVSPRHVLSDVQLLHDSTVQDAYPGIKQSNFIVTQAKLAASDDVHLTVEWVDSGFRLDTAAWREYSGNEETQERIKAGRKILQEMRLNVNDQVVPTGEI